MPRSIMIKTILVILFVCVNVPVIGLSGDLTLVEISSQKEVAAIKSIVPYALGVINGRFLVDLEREHVNQMKAAGIEYDVIARNFEYGRYCIVRENRVAAEAPIELPSIYTAGNIHVAELDPGEMQVLARSGYNVKTIGSKKIPIYYNPPVLPVRQTDQELPTDTLADLINQDSLYSYVTRLEAFQSRHITGDSIDGARDYILEQFISFGYTDAQTQYFVVNSDPWDIFNEPCWNVYCTKFGAVYPDNVIVIGAHYDSYNNEVDPAVFAPGADDNASGVAAVMEMARIFKNFDNEKTMIFAAFSAEEQGSLGSEFMAGELEGSGIEKELMLNLDMLGFTDDAIPDVCLYPGYRDENYYDFFSEIACRVTDLLPNNSPIFRTDDYSFDDMGWPTLFYIEGDFNFDGWHTSLDISSRMDFEYLRKVTQASIAGIGAMDLIPQPITCVVYDIGDGQSLRVVWDDCYQDYTYQITYGTNVWHLNDTLDVPAGECHIDVTGLNEGQNYYIGVIAIADEGLSQLALSLSQGMPLSVPRAPTGLVSVSDTDAVYLDWVRNQELDINHYRVLRKPVGYNWEVIGETCYDTSFADNSLLPHQNYIYTVLAVDDDDNFSDSSNFVFGVMVTLDLGVLFIDETQMGGINPTEQEQQAFYEGIMGDYDYFRKKIDSVDDALECALAAQYNPLFWVDDDSYNHVLEGSLDSLAWYFSYNVDFLLAGWQTIYSITGQRYFYPGNFYYDELGISYIAQNPLDDFSGPDSVGDWPVLELKPEAPGGARMPDIDVFTAIPGAEVIYTFNSYSSHPFYDGRPVGIAYDTHHGKRVILGFPLYWLTEESAQALIGRVMDYFAEESIPPYGDVNNDFAVNILDITYLISYLYQDGPPPQDMNYGDPNGDCNINILDITYLISFLYKGGPEPVEGCVYKD